MNAHRKISPGLDRLPVPSRVEQLLGRDSWDWQSYVDAGLREAADVASGALTPMPGFKLPSTPAAMQAYAEGWARLSCPAWKRLLAVAAAFGEGC